RCRHGCIAGWSFEQFERINLGSFHQQRPESRSEPQPRPAGHGAGGSIVAHSAGPQVDRIMMNPSVNNVAAFAGFGSNLRVKELEEQVLSMRTAVICGFNQLLDLKDLNTGVHSTRLAEWAVRVAEGLGIDERVLRDVEAAAILHDIGKIGVPDAILNKPGKLTEAERQII